MGCQKLTYHQKPELNIVSTEKELTFEKSSLNSRSSSDLTNHLGNVMVTVSDRKVWNNTDQVYEPVIVTKSDFYPFGMLQPDRHEGLGDQRFLFNGMEADAEVSGDGNSYTTQFRQYDPRLGRWKSLDPKRNYQESPYSGLSNSPILFNDALGDTVKFANKASMGAYMTFKISVEMEIFELQREIVESGLGDNTSPRLSKLLTIREELRSLETSDEIYRVRFGEEASHKATKGSLYSNPETGGKVAFNYETMELDIYLKKSHFLFNFMEIISHEFKHAFQFENFQIDFRRGGGGQPEYGGAYDLTDEREAFQRQQLFADNLSDVEIEGYLSKYDLEDKAYDVSIDDNYFYRLNNIFFKIGEGYRTMSNYTSQRVTKGSVGAFKKGRKKAEVNIKESIEWQMNPD